MKKFVRKFAVNVLVLICLIEIFPSTSSESAGYVLLAALVLSLLNLFIKPILFLLSLPVTLLTLGLFSFFVNAFIIKIMDWMISGIYLGSFWIALLGAISITFVNIIAKDLLEERKSS